VVSRSSWFAVSVVVVVVVLVGVGCVSVGDGDGDGAEGMNVVDGVVVWDLREPQTAAGLGSRVSDFVELDGPASVRVVFPSGRSTEGMFGRGALGETAKPPMPGHVSGVIGRVTLLESSVTSAAGLRESGERFVAEWGEGTFRGRSIGEFLDDVDALFGSDEVGSVDLSGFAPPGENAFAFVAEEVDGVQPAWLTRFTFHSIQLRVTLDFDPGVP
jgi:hypothetical protein